MDPIKIKYSITVQNFSTESSFELESYCFSLEEIQESVKTNFKLTQESTGDIVFFYKPLDTKGVFVILSDQNIYEAVENYLKIGEKLVVYCSLREDLEEKSIGIRVSEEEMEGEIEKLRKSLGEKEAVIREKDAELREANGKYREIEGKFKNQSDGLMRNKGELKDKEDEIGELKERNRDLGKKMEIYKEKYRLSRRFLKLEEVNTCEFSLISIRNKTVGEHEKILKLSEVLKGENMRLRAELNDLKKDYDLRLKELSEKDAEIKRIEGGKKTCENQMKETEKRLKEKEDEIKGYERKIGEMSDLIKQREEWKESKEKKWGRTPKDNEVNQLFAEKDYNVLLKDYETLQAEHEKLTDQYDKLEEEKVALSAKNEELKEINEENIKKNKSLLEELKNKVDISILEEYSENLKDLEREYDEIVDENKKLENQNKSLTQEINENSAENKGSEFMKNFDESKRKGKVSAFDFKNLFSNGKAYATYSQLYENYIMCFDMLKSNKNTISQLMNEKDAGKKKIKKLALENEGLRDKINYLNKALMRVTKSEKGKKGEENSNENVGEDEEEDTIDENENEDNKINKVNAFEIKKMSGDKKNQSQKQGKGKKGNNGTKNDSLLDSNNNKINNILRNNKIKTSKK